MDTKEAIIKASRNFLEFNPSSHPVRWVMVVFLLFCGVPQKTVAVITNYTDRQVRNIRDRFENGDFPQDGEKRGRKKKIKKRIFGRIVKYIVDHPRSTLKNVARYLKEEYELELSVKTIERELEEYDLSDLGFVILTGRNSVLSRTTLFRWIKGCRKTFVLRFYDLTRARDKAPNEGKGDEGRQALLRI